MHSTTTYAIYWVPSGFSVSQNYESLINRYLTDVAAESGHSTNVYSAATQYYDATGPISYQSSFAGSYVDTASAIPTNHCNDGGNHKCVTDADIQAEIQHVLTVTGWHGGSSHMFFVMTADGVGSCFDGSSSECTSDTYCAYHNAFTSSSNDPVIYANQPYDASITGCDSGNSPNGDDADSTINTMSHEHNEAVTDPFGDAWWNFASGQENGDNCAWVFGTPLGGTPGVDEYNQVINGHHYWVQEEWSNDGSDCRQHYLGIPVNFGAPTVSGVAEEGKALSVTPGTWSQSPTSYAYRWQRCAVNGTGCVAILGATSATYSLTAADGGHTIRSTISAQNAAGSSAFVTTGPTAVVIPLPAATAPPVVSGVALIGKQLSTTSGAWNTPASFTYQWLRCSPAGTGCTAIPGATSSSYVAAAADAGHRLQARVSATNVVGTTQALSDLSGGVVGAPRIEHAPQISGHARVGRRLSATTGTWSGPPESYRYQWLRCNSHGRSCRRIRHATRPTYRLGRPDAGHRLRVRVTAINAAGSTTAVSRGSARVR